jgi:hypothetical protein
MMLHAFARDYASRYLRHCHTTPPTYADYFTPHFFDVFITLKMPIRHFDGLAEAARPPTADSRASRRKLRRLLAVATERHSQYCASRRLISAYAYGQPVSDSHARAGDWLRRQPPRQPGW